MRQAVFPKIQNRIPHSSSRQAFVWYHKMDMHHDHRNFPDEVERQREKDKIGETIQD